MNCTRTEVKSCQPDGDGVADKLPTGLKGGHSQLVGVNSRHETAQVESTSDTQSRPKASRRRPTVRQCEDQLISSSKLGTPRVRTLGTEVKLADSLPDAVLADCRTELLKSVVALSSGQTGGGHAKMNIAGDAFIGNNLTKAQRRELTATADILQDYEINAPIVDAAYLLPATVLNKVDSDSPSRIETDDSLSHFCDVNYLFDCVRNEFESTEPAKFRQFMDTVVQFESSAVDCFRRLHVLCRGHVEIQEMLLDLLSPAQAMMVGKSTYGQCVNRMKQKAFVAKLRRAYLSRAASLSGRNTSGPSEFATYHKVLKELASTLLVAANQYSSADSWMTEASLRALAVKLFKSNRHLHDSFLALVLPCVIDTDFAKGNSQAVPSAMPEMLDLTGLDADASTLHYSVNSEAELVNLDNSVSRPSASSSSNLTVGGDRRLLLSKATGSEDPLGGDECPCSCHVEVLSSPTVTSRQQEAGHCLHCSIKFINGYVYLREGRLLKPARVVH